MGLFVSMLVLMVGGILALYVFFEVLGYTPGQPSGSAAAK